MKRLLVTFKYFGLLDIPEGDEKVRNKYIFESLQQLMQDGGKVALLGYEEIHAGEIDNHCDQEEEVTEEHTLLEIRLLVDPAKTDLHDGGEELYYQVLEDLNSCEKEITYIYSCGDDLTKVVVGMDMHHPYQSLQFEDPEDMERLA